MERSLTIPDAIRRYYDTGIEGPRLGEGSGPLERTRTEDAARRCWPCCGGSRPSPPLCP